MNKGGDDFFECKVQKYVCGSHPEGHTVSASLLLNNRGTISKDVRQMSEYIVAYKIDKPFR